MYKVRCKVLDVMDQNMIQQWEVSGSIKAGNFLNCQLPKSLSASESVTCL